MPRLWAIRIERWHAWEASRRWRKLEIRRKPSLRRWRERQTTERAGRRHWERAARAWANASAGRDGWWERRHGETWTAAGAHGRHATARSTGKASGERAGWRHGEAGWGHAAWEGEGRHAGGWRWECAAWSAEAAAAKAAVAAAGLVLGKHGVVVGLAFGGVGGGDGVDDGLGFLVADLLVVVDDVADVVAACVVGFAHAHGVVRQVDVAVVAEDCLRRLAVLIAVARIRG